MDCIFNETLHSYVSCRFYPRFKNIPFPLGQSFAGKPAFCQIKKIVVYEEPSNESWPEPDIKG
jgi:hypothetical protein